MILASADQAKSTKIAAVRTHNQKQFFVRFWPKTYTLLKLYSKIDVIIKKLIYIFFYKFF